MSGGAPTQNPMDRGAGFWKVFGWTGLLLAAAVYMADPVEPILAAVSDAPGSFTGIEVNGTSAHQYASATNGEESAQLFGMQTEQVTEGALLDKWRRVKGDITRDLEVRGLLGGNGIIA